MGAQQQIKIWSSTMMTSYFIAKTHYETTINTNKRNRCDHTEGKIQHLTCPSMVWQGVRVEE